MKYYAIILASGTGSRAELDIPKQFYKISKKTVLEYSIEAFENHPKIDNIILVSNPDYIDLTKNIIEKNNYKKIINILPGGKTRQESSYIGTSAVMDKHAAVLIHDAARPFVSQKIITDCIEALKTYKAVNVAVETSDTVIIINDKNIINNVPERKYVKRCQTPQCFEVNTIKKAHELAIKHNYTAATDDCGLVLKYNLSDIYVVNGCESNIKITYPFDIPIAENIIKTILK